MLRNGVILVAMPETCESATALRFASIDSIFLTFLKYCKCGADQNWLDKDVFERVKIWKQDKNPYYRCMRRASMKSAAECRCLQVVLLPFGTFCGRVLLIWSWCCLGSRKKVQREDQSIFLCVSPDDMILAKRDVNVIKMIPHMMCRPIIFCGFTTTRTTFVG